LSCGRLELCDPQVDEQSFAARRQRRSAVPVLANMLGRMSGWLLEASKLVILLGHEATVDC
jgi:hypothetical protein